MKGNETYIVSKHTNAYIDWLRNKSRNIIHSLHSEVVCTNRDAHHKLEGRPEAVELSALIHIHDTVGWRGAMPDGVLQEGLDPGEDDLPPREQGNITLRTP